MDTEEVNYRTSQQRARLSRTFMMELRDGRHVEWTFRTGSWYWRPVREVIDPAYWSGDFNDPNAIRFARITTWHWLSFGACLVEVKT